MNNKGSSVFFPQKIEDTDLDLKPLPTPKLVPTPDGIANELFGDIIMITEFINGYRGLLLPEDERLFTAGEPNSQLDLRGRG